MNGDRYLVIQATLLGCKSWLLEECNLEESFTQSNVVRKVLGLNPADDEVFMAILPLKYHHNDGFLSTKFQLPLILTKSSFYSQIILQLNPDSDYT